MAKVHYNIDYFDVRRFSVVCAFVFRWMVAVGLTHYYSFCF